MGLFVVIKCLLPTLNTMEVYIEEKIYLGCVSYVCE